MSDSYALVLLSVLLTDKGYRSRLQDHGVNISSQPSRWPTLGEVSEVLDHLENCKTWAYSLGKLGKFADLYIANEHCDLSIWLDEPYPTGPNEQLKMLDFNGYCDLIEPFLDSLSLIGVMIVVVRMNDGGIVYAPLNNN